LCSEPHFDHTLRSLRSSPSS